MQKISINWCDTGCKILSKSFAINIKYVFINVIIAFWYFNANHLFFEFMILILWFEERIKSNNSYHYSQEKASKCTSQTKFTVAENVSLCSSVSVNENNVVEKKKNGVQLQYENTFWNYLLFLVSVYMRRIITSCSLLWNECMRINELSKKWSEKKNAHSHTQKKINCETKERQTANKQLNEMFAFAFKYNTVNAQIVGRRQMYCEMKCRNNSTNSKKQLKWVA